MVIVGGLLLALHALVLIMWSTMAATPTDDPEASVPGSKRHVATVDGDIILGALFPIHRQPPMKTAYTRKCGEIWEQYGMHRIEIFLRTLDRINDDESILPNVTLGCDIRDSCWYAPVALEQSIDFIKNSISSLEQRQNINKTGADACKKEHQKPIAGLIGPGSSTVTIQIQNLLSLFNIPQIGYSATSKDLSDKSLYKYFLRVVPSDKLQARAMLDLVKHYNWSYISTVYTEGNYGFSGMQEFNRMAKKEGICEATQDKVPNNADDEAFDTVVENLKKTENARVVVCFCEGWTVRGLLRASQRLGAQGRFLFIGSDGWADRPDVVEYIEDSAVGGMSFKLYSPSLKDFDDYFFSLRPYKKSRNPWFWEFWQQKFKCFLPFIPEEEQDKRFENSCSGHEDLSREYVQDAKLGFVVNAIYTMAYALDAMHRQVCLGRPGICPEMNPVNGTIFLKHLLSASFNSYSNDPIMFDELGDPPGRYDIMNFQKITINGTSRYEYVKVGGWDSGNLTMDTAQIFWPDEHQQRRPQVIESICSKPCPRGQVKRQRGGVHCCWVCTACKDNEIMQDESTCHPCPKGWWPNEELTGCLMIPIEHLKWGDTEAVVAMVFAFVGIFATIFVTAVFVRHNNTPVVKASTRELSYIILIGITLSYLTTFPLVAKPSLVTCYLVRLLPGLSFSLIYGALVTKTNRIARILAGSKKKIMTRKPRFMSACAQVVITFMLIGVEAAIITVMLILEPADSKLVYPIKTRVKLTCNATTMGIIVPLGFDIFLIVMCTLYAVKTRNLPENFNEAKFIGFTMYTTCVIWVAFVPIYFGSDNKVITMCLAITLSATVAMVLLFFPKVFIMLCKPERNARSAFTTAKDVRCHIGSTAGRSYSTSNDSLERNEKTFENAALSIYRQKNFFNRWKSKSLREPPPKPPNGQTGAGRRGATPYRGYTRNNSVSTYEAQRPTSLREHMAMRDSERSGSRRSSSRRSRGYPLAESDLGGSRSSWTSDRTVSTDGDLLEETVRSPKVDSCSQTDDELLETYVPGLRRRAVKTDSSGSARSSEDRTTTSRKPSRASTADRELQTEAAQAHTFDTSETEETDCLLYKDRSRHMASLQGSEPGGGEHSPLLAGRDKTDDDSTSEETLSEANEPGALEDLDDILSGVCTTHEDSFGSLCMADWQAQVDGGSDRYDSRRMSDTLYRNGSSSDDLPVSITLPGDRDRLRQIEGPLISSPLRLAKSAPVLVEPGPSGLGFGQDSCHVAVPNVIIQQASPCPSDQSSCSARSIDSGRPSAESRDLTFNSQEDLPAIPNNGYELKPSHRRRGAKSADGRSSDSVDTFQAYLRTRGLDLDLTTVQSSDV